MFVLIRIGTLRYGDYGLRTTAGRLLSFVCSSGLSHANIHAFNKSGRRLEFSMNDVVRGKIIHLPWPDESSVDVDFAVCSYKKKCFYFTSRGIEDKRELI